MTGDYPTVAAAPQAVEVDHRPAPVGSVAAVIAAAAATALVASDPVQLGPLALVAAGVLVLGVGNEVRRRGHVVVGALLLVAGAEAALVGLGLGATQPPRATDRVELVPGMIGVILLGLGLLPVREGRARTFVTAGSAAVVAGALLSGVVHGAGTVPLLAAVAGAVVAWDAGERAIALGEQVGRGARTAAVEAVHAAASAGFGLLAVAAAAGVYEVDLAALPLVGLVLLVAAAILLVTTLAA